MRDLSHLVVDIAKAALTRDIGNLVFVSRETLTKVYREGIEEGQRRARQDQWAERHIGILKAKQEEQEAAG